MGPNFFHLKKYLYIFTFTTEWPFYFGSHWEVKKNNNNQYPTLLWNTNTMFQAAESARHPDLDVTRVGNFMTLLRPMFCKASLPFKLLLLGKCSSQLIKCSSMSLEPSNPLPFGLLKGLVLGTRLNSNWICKRIRKLPTSCIGHIGTQSRTQLEFLVLSLEHHFPD